MASDKLDDIIREHTPRLRSYVRGRVGNHDDADDIVQDTFYQWSDMQTLGRNSGTGVIVLLCCIPFYILSFAQMALPISVEAKGVL